MTARPVEPAVAEPSDAGARVGVRPAVPVADRASAALPPSAVERMTLILDVFTGPHDRLSLEEVTRATGLPRSTAHRLLEGLTRLQWLEHSALGYTLGRRALELSAGGRGHADIRATAAPHLHELMLRTGLVVHLAVLDGHQVHYLDKLGGRFAREVPSRVGGRAPAHATALGKAMLAWVDGERVDALVGPHLRSRTPRTICELTALHHDLRRVRERNGLAFERGESFPHLSCAAVAIRGPHAPVAAISVVGPAGSPLERVAPVLVEAARQVSQELFGEAATESSARRLRAVAAR